jgi:ABC-type branched-subunit amino acid transport system substrate-binding protein
VSQDLAAEFVTSLNRRGIQVVGQTTYTEGVSSPAAAAERLKDSGANVFVGATEATSFIDIYSRAKALGVKLNVALNASGYSAGLLAQRGPDMAGMSIMSGFVGVDSPAMQSYEKAMSTYAPELVDPGDEVALSSYVAADEMILGLQLAGPCPTRAAFIQDLRKVTDFTGSGLIAPVDLSNPMAPDTCFNFLKVDPTGRAFTSVPPPTALGQGGFWCGQSGQ